MKCEMNSYGPWSTSLDAGRLQLSAFWKRRMKALVSLPSSTHRLSRGCVTAALATVVLLGAAPLVQLSSDAAAIGKEANGNGEVESKRDSAADEERASYGRVIERTVNDNGHGEYLIDFDSGKTFERPDSPRPSNHQEFVDWARFQGIDAMGQVASGYKGLMGFDMIVIPTSAESWDQRAGGVVESLKYGEAGTPGIMDARAELPATFFFETREGARGVVQITHIEEDNDQPGPDHVKLRYRLISTIGGEQPIRNSAPSTNATRPATDENEFVARFSNGVEVEFIGLSINPSKEQPWWRPDGAPLAERPYDNVRAHMGSGLPRELCFRWKNLPKDPDYTLSWHTVPPYEGAGGGPADAQGKTVKGLWASAIGMPGSLETCTVQFSASVSSTPWKTVFEDTGRHYASMASGIDGKQRGVIWSPARVEGDEVLITVSYKAPGESVRMVAVYKGEKRHAAVRCYGNGAWDFMQQTFAFDKVSLKEIKKFELQTQMREIETVEFTNVSLHPDKITKVEKRIVQRAEKAARQ
jgi:hypothetical protein